MKNNEIKLIKEELTRLKEKAEQAVDIHELFDIIYDFVDLIEKTPILKRVIDEEDKQWQKLWDYIYGREWEKQEYLDFLAEHTYNNICHSNNYPYIYHVYKYIEESRDPDMNKEKEYSMIGDIYLKPRVEDDRPLFHLGFWGKIRYSIRKYKRERWGEEIFKEKNRERLTFENRMKSFNGSVIFVYKRLIQSLEKQEYLNNLEEINKKQPEKNVIKELWFDDKNSVLHINRFKIRIARQKSIEDNVEHIIMKYLFEREDLSEDLSYSEISVDKLGVLNEGQYKEQWKHYSSKCDAACRRINEKVRNGTQETIKELLKSTTGESGYVKINPEYKIDLKKQEIEPKI